MTGETRVVGGKLWRELLNRADAILRSVSPMARRAAYVSDRACGVRADLLRTRPKRMRS